MGGAVSLDALKQVLGENSAAFAAAKSVLAPGRALLSLARGQ